MARSRHNPVIPVHEVGRAFVRMPKYDPINAATIGNYGPIYFVGPGTRFGYGDRIIVGTWDWRNVPWGSYAMTNIQDFHSEKEALMALRMGRYVGMPLMAHPPYNLVQVKHPGTRGVPPLLLSSNPFELDIYAHPGEQLHAEPYPYPWISPDERYATASDPFYRQGAPVVTPYGIFEDFTPRATPVYYASRTPEDVMEDVVREQWKEALEQGAPPPADPSPWPFPRKNSFITHYAGEKIRERAPYASNTSQRGVNPAPAIPEAACYPFYLALAEKLVLEGKGKGEAGWDLTAAQKKKFKTLSSLSYRSITPVVRGDIRYYILDWKFEDEEWRYSVPSNTVHIY